MRQLLERVRGLEKSLRSLDLAAARMRASQAVAERITAAVVDTLSHRPGDDHTAPWEQTATLLNAIANHVTETEIIVASTDPVAVFQEQGTAVIPPRPFLAPAGAVEGEGAARDIAVATVEALKEALR